MADPSLHHPSWTNFTLDARKSRRYKPTTGYGTPRLFMHAATSVCRTQTHARAKSICAIAGGRCGAGGLVTSPDGPINTTRNTPSRAIQRTTTPRSAQRPRMKRGEKERWRSGGKEAADRVERTPMHAPLALGPARPTALLPSTNLRHYPALPLPRARPPSHRPGAAFPYPFP